QVLAPAARAVPWRGRPVVLHVFLVVGAALAGRREPFHTTAQVEEAPAVSEAKGVRKLRVNSEQPRPRRWLDGEPERGAPPGGAGHLGAYEGADGVANRFIHIWELGDAWDAAARLRRYLKGGAQFGRRQFVGGPKLGGVQALARGHHGDLELGGKGFLGGEVP